MDRAERTFNYCQSREVRRIGVVFYARLQLRQELGVL
jgi:hypothetical protein